MEEKITELISIASLNKEKFAEKTNHKKFFSNNRRYLKKNIIRKKINLYRKFKNTKQNKKNFNVKPERENRNLN